MDMRATHLQRRRRRPQTARDGSSVRTAETQTRTRDTWGEVTCAALDMKTKAQRRRCFVSLRRTARRGMHPCWCVRGFWWEVCARHAGRTYHTSCATRRQGEGVRASPKSAPPPRPSLFQPIVRAAHACSRRRRHSRAFNSSHWGWLPARERRARLPGASEAVVCAHSRPHGDQPIIAPSAAAADGLMMANDGLMTAVGPLAP
mmetsp:Transcript_26295/g.69762  ORF Transcript_26295/g.69762 Transcript_26295/m.69762 type:complete len:203 (+) Transcript_26295:174-782(+)